MLYKNKSIIDFDTYYGINTDSIPYPHWKHKDCEKIQQAFNNHAIMLTLTECKEIYENYSDETLCASWENGIDDMSLEEIFKLLLPWLKGTISDRINRLTVIVDELKQNGYLESEDK